MCLENVTKARTTKRDLTVYKLVRHITDPMQFKQSIKGIQIVEQKWGLTKKGVYAEYSGYRFDTKELHVAKHYKLPNGMMNLSSNYEPGFHAFLKKQDAANYNNDWYNPYDQMEVLEFVVPKGSIVRYGNTGFSANRKCIVSSQLINPRFKE